MEKIHSATCKSCSKLVETKKCNIVNLHIVKKINKPVMRTSINRQRQILEFLIQELNKDEGIIGDLCTT